MHLPALPSHSPTLPLQIGCTKKIFLPAPLALQYEFKARGWWPLSRSSTKIFFWRFVFLWVNLALLNPIERFSWRVCVAQATKKEEESCSFLTPLGGPLSRLTKIDKWENPSFDSTGSRQLVGTLRYALTLSSDVTCTSTHVRVSLVSPLHACRWACYWKRSGKFCTISDPPPPPSLSPCLSVWPDSRKRITSAKHDIQNIQAKVR